MANILRRENDLTVLGLASTVGASKKRGARLGARSRRSSPRSRSGPTPVDGGQIPVSAIGLHDQSRA